MNRTEKIAAEIAAEEKKIFNKPAPKKEEKAVDTKEEPIEVQGETPTKVIEKEPVVENDPEVVKSQPEPDNEDWKKRFSNFKASADATIHGLRKTSLAQDEEIQALRKTIDSLRDKVAELSNKDPYANLFSEEEKEIIGEETLAALKKAQEAFAESKLKPLKEELETERKKRLESEEKRIKDERKALNEQFLRKLEVLVPNFRTIDVNPNFLKWMEGVDTASGYPRVNIFKAAQSAGDVGRVAEFFKEYEALTVKKDKLAEKITPAPSQATPIIPKKQNKPTGLTFREINQFYDDVSRGKYRNRKKEQQEMERKIDDHLRKSGMDRR